MLRRLHPEQPESFAFTPTKKAWAEAQITKCPEERYPSAVSPLLWRTEVGASARAVVGFVAAMADRFVTFFA